MAQIDRGSGSGLGAAATLALFAEDRSEGVVAGRVDRTAEASQLPATRSKISCPSPQFVSIG
jgi:hypothetical protein